MTYKVELFNSRLGKYFLDSCRKGWSCLLGGMGCFSRFCEAQLNQKKGKMWPGRKAWWGGETKHLANGDSS